MYPNMTSVFPFTYDETGSFGNDKSFIITEKDNSQNLPKGTENVIASEAKQSNAKSHPGAEGDRAHLLKALLAIFNSDLVKLWIWYNCPELMGGTREIRKAYFENLRIPLDNAELLHQLATLADEIIAAKTNGEDTASLEEKVNKNVYKLYGVTDIMDRNVKK